MTIVIFFGKMADPDDKSWIVDVAGPFETGDDAVRYANKHYPNTRAEIRNLTPPR